MALTQTEREFYEYCRNHEFIPAPILSGFTRRLEQEDNRIAISVGLDKFITDSCPNCNDSGAFKWHFMGKLRHPGCGWSWYVGPGTYAAAQLKAVFRTGMELGTEMGDDTDRRGEKGGCLGAIMGFIMGIFFRLPFALAMIPIQTIASLSQKQSKPKK